MESDGPVVKRQRVADAKRSVAHRRPHQSCLFAPYRTVGLVSPTAVPFTTVPLGKTTFQITTSVGRSLQTYDLRRGLNLVFITRPQTPGPITATSAWRDHLFAAWSDEKSTSVWAFKRGKFVAELETPKLGGESINSFCIFGSWIVGVCRTHLIVWKSTTFELYTTLQGVSPIPFVPCVTSLPTLLNKIAVGREDGSVELWNVSSGKLLYTILPPSTTHGAVSALTPTPALSLVAIAYEGGAMIIHDVRADETVLQFSTSSATPITSISFRTDGAGAGEGGQKAGIMATASLRSGDVTMWDLNDGGRKVGVLRSAHADPIEGSPGGISKIEFLSGQAILVSTGLDNSLKTWIFDETPFSPVPRPLHARTGHAAPLTRLMFLPSATDGSDDSGKWLMSAGHDRSLWAWSLRRDGQSTELSQGAVQSKAKKHGLLSAKNRDGLADLKCPPITSIACSLNRDGGIGAMPGKQPIWKNETKAQQASAEISATTGWESIATTHENDKRVRTWFWGRKRAGRWAFETSDGGIASSVALSPCGTFAVVGSSLGGIDMFNMQSGIHRQRYPARLTPMQAKQLRTDIERRGLVEEGHGKAKFYRGQGKHTSAVRGVAVDSLNKNVISAGEDGKIKIWDFDTGLLLRQIDWTSTTGITGMQFQRSADLAIVACTDGCIRIVDTTSLKLIRELWPSRPLLEPFIDKQFSDFVISTDSRWVAACIDQIVFVWDLPTGHLVDGFKLEHNCASLAFSPTGEYLATTTRGSVGVEIWSNRTVYVHVPTRHLTNSAVEQILNSKAQAPAVSGESGAVLVNAEQDTEYNDDDIIPLDDNTEVELDRISADLLSLSLVPRPRWQNLLHLDLIRQRNKPTEAPAKPEKAPFFLPSLQDKQANGNSKSNHSTALDVTAASEQSRFLKVHGHDDYSTFTKLLRASAERNEFKGFLDHLKSLPPAAADVEIRSLSIEKEETLTFVRALTWLMRSRNDFELGQAWMAVFLRVHGDIVVAQSDLQEAVATWKEALHDERTRMQKLSGYVGGMMSWLRAARV